MPNIKPFFFYLLLLSLLGCQKEAKRTIKKTAKKEVKSPYDFKIVEKRAFMFRRNYFYNDSIYENEKALKELDNRNPETLDARDFVLGSKYFNGVKNLNLFDTDLNLNIKTWDLLRKREAKAMMVNGKKYSVTIDYDVVGHNFKIEDGKRIMAKQSFKIGYPPDVSFMVYDIDQDHQDEILAFSQWYIINGDNYDIYVYEIEKN